jgi:hypothetical protein
MARKMALYHSHLISIQLITDTVFRLLGSAKLPTETRYRGGSACQCVPRTLEPIRMHITRSQGRLLAPSRS